ncbi:MAG: hypothetical protein CME06_12450 [Gemmatimonadetes bacterium]|nr:hypothetical protein [Gemmatimonadota bacterium]
MTPFRISWARSAWIGALVSCIPATAGAVEPELDLPEVVIEGVDRPRRPMADRDPAEAEIPEAPDGVVRGAKAPDGGAPTSLPLALDVSPRTSAPLRLSGLVAGGNLGRRELGAGARVRSGKRELRAAARGFDADRHSAIAVVAAATLSPDWSVEANLLRRERELWGMPPGTSDSRAGAEASLRFAPTLRGDWKMQSLGGVGWGRAELEGAHTGERSGTFVRGLTQVSGGLTGSRIVGGASLGVESDLSVAEVWTQLARPTDRKLAFRLGIGGLIAGLENETGSALELLGAVDLAAAPGLELSLELSSEADVLGSRWWARIAPPVDPSRLFPAMSRSSPRLKAVMRNRETERLEVSYAQRIDGVIWAESAEIDGLWIQTLADSRAIEARAETSLSGGLDLDIWLERAWAEGGRQPSYLSPWIWRARADAQLKSLRLWSAIRGASGTPTGRDETEIPAWITLDLGGSIDVGWGVTVAIDTVNLMNESWSVWRGFAEAGPAAHLSIRYRWRDGDIRLPRTASWFEEDRR